MSIIRCLCHLVAIAGILVPAIPVVHGHDDTGVIPTDGLTP